MKKTLSSYELYSTEIQEEMNYKSDNENQKLCYNYNPIVYSNPKKREKVLSENMISNLCLEMLRMDREERPVVLFKWVQPPQKRVITATLTAKKPRKAKSTG